MFRESWFCRELFNLSLQKTRLLTLFPRQTLDFPPLNNKSVVSLRLPRPPLPIADFVEPVSQILSRNGAGYYSLTHQFSRTLLTLLLERLN